MPIPPYIARLRERIGTDLLWLPGVTAVVLDGSGRLLLGQRSDNGNRETLRLLDLTFAFLADPTAGPHFGR